MAFKVDLRPYVENVPKYLRPLVLAEFGKQVVKKARSYAPVDTGYLKSKIYYSSGYIHSDAPYAQYLEIGTYKMQAQPYVYPAIRAVSVQTIREGIMERLGGGEPLKSLNQGLPPQQGEVEGILDNTDATVVKLVKQEALRSFRGQAAIRKAVTTKGFGENIQYDEVRVPREPDSLYKHLLSMIRGRRL